MAFGRRVAQCEGFTRRPLKKQNSNLTHRKAAKPTPQPSDISNGRKS